MMAGIYAIAGSALVAQRQRLALVAANMANADSVTATGGTPYRARFAVFEATPLGNHAPGAAGGDGVRVAGVTTSDAPFKERYEPGNPLANAQGYVLGSNVSMVQQVVDMTDAVQSYQANLAVLEQTQQINRALIQAI